MYVAVVILPRRGYSGVLIIECGELIELGGSWYVWLGVTSAWVGENTYRGKTEVCQQGSVSYSLGMRNVIDC